MSIYEDMQGVARELLTEFNQGTKKYVDIVPGNGPVDEPGAPTETRYDIVGTVIGISFKYVQQGLGVASDLQMSAPVDPRYEPKITGFIEIGSKRYKIVNIVRKPEAGTVVAYAFIIRRNAP